MVDTTPQLGALREGLARYALALAEVRDEDHRRCQGGDPHGQDIAFGHASGVKYALALLHIHTNGEYGALFGDQPDLTRPPVTELEVA